MTKQEIFDKVARHLLTQMQRSVGDDGECKYRTSDGLSCAIGCLISEEFYTSVIEGKSVNADFVQSALAKSLGISYLSSDFVDIMLDLQILHDRIHIEDWPERLRYLAQYNDLSDGVIDDVLAERNYNV